MLGVATSVFLSRHHLMLLEVALVVYDVATSDFLSRHYSFNFCSFLSCLRCDPCRDLHQIPFNLPDVATSELDCVDLKTASIAQPIAFISALLLTAFLSTYCCIFLLYCFFLANDKLVSFFIILYINYSILTENQTEKWTKKRSLLSSSIIPTEIEKN